VHADVKHKLIQSYAVSAANVADNRHFVSLLSGSVPKKTPEWRVWADAAYHSKQAETALAEKGLASSGDIPFTIQCIPRCSGKCRAALKYASASSIFSALSKIPWAGNLFAQSV
jgi:hypothetical protein